MCLRRKPGKERPEVTLCCLGYKVVMSAARLTYICAHVQNPAQYWQEVVSKDYDAVQTSERDQLSLLEWTDILGMRAWSSSCREDSKEQSISGT